jgi:hypothetical protein
VDFSNWLSFIVSIAATSLGVIYLPVDAWIKGYLGMGLLFTVGSTINLSKTVRDIEESKRLINCIDEVKLERLLSQYDHFTKLGV